MPELPEVESVVRDIRPFVCGKKICDVEIFLPRLVKTDVDAFCISLVGQSIKSVERRGKYILISLGNKKLLVIHLRMTGALIYLEKGSQKSEPYTRIKFCLEDGSRLIYADSRTLGTLHLVDGICELKGLAELGLEPLAPDFSADYLRERLARKKGSIKGALLNQEIIAGLGNIYVDEALFRSGIHPERVALTLEKKELSLLHREIQEVIREALGEGGTTFRDYRNGLGEAGNFQERLKVYGREGKPCTKCGKALEKIRVVGRGTHFCRYCQK